MSTKSVLVNYSERNKVFTIPQSTDIYDLSYLEKEFRKEFKFQANVNLEISFQRFEKDWDEYVELDKSCILNHREKLKAVVTPLLTDGSLSEVTTPKGCTSISETPKRVDDISLTDIAMSSSTVVTESDGISDTELGFGQEMEYDDCGANSVSPDALSDNTGTPSRLVVDKDCDLPEKKRKKLIKTEDDSIPLPNPFPLPKYYRADVEEALKNRRMTRETTSAFYSAVASAMLVYKKYPTREDYVTVGRAIIEKYDFLSQPVGTPYGASVTTLMNRFKEFRRTPVPRDISSSSGKKRQLPKKKRPGITQTPRRPLFPTGEDVVSLERHTRILKTEFKKKNRNDQVVSELMDRTFPLRRQTILEQPMNLDSIFEKFPFLQESGQLMKELERISYNSNLRAESKKKWKEVALRVIAQAQLEKRNRGVCSALEICETIKDYKELSALILLVALLPDSRCKVDTSKVMYMALGCSSDVSSIALNNERLEPYIIISGDHELKASLVVDKCVIDSVSMTELPYTLMSAFFVYNICYPKGCNNFYSMLEILVLNYSLEKASPTVKYLLPKILPSTTQNMV